MPTFVYGCQCGYEQETVHPMRDNPEIVCPMCGKRCERIPQLTSVIWPSDAYWGNENKGKGKWICGLGKKNDPKAYCTSLSQAEDRAKARNLNYEKA